MIRLVHYNANGASCTVLSGLLKGTVLYDHSSDFVVDVDKELNDCFFFKQLSWAGRNDQKAGID
jgi:hypothetical protein